MRNANDTHTQRHATDLEFRNRRRSLDRLSRGQARVARLLRSNFRFGIFGSIRNPFPLTLSLSSDTQHNTALNASAGIPFVLSLRSPLVVQSPSFARAPLASNFTASSVTETRARENRRGAERSGQDGKGGRGFQMDINSSASSTPRSSLITLLQLLSLIKASGCWWMLRQAASTRETRRKNANERVRERNRETLSDPFI